MESPYSFKGGKTDLFNLMLSLYHIVICKINPNTRKITQKVVVKCGSQGEFSLLGSTIYFSVQKKNGRWHMCANLTKAFTKEEIARWFNGYRQKVESCGLTIDADQSEAL